ncbi:MAG: hypothetical protein ACK5VI_07540 [Opitutia bacterium]|jgi:hypothetical protein
MSTTTTYSPLQKRIRRTGLVGRAVCTFLLLAGTLVVAAWLFAIHGAGQWSIEHLAKTPEQTAFYQRLAAEGGYRAVVTAIVVLGGVLVLGALHSLRTVFAAASECRLISLESSRELRKLGIFLIILATLDFINLGTLLSGLLLLLFAWSLEEAVALKREQDLTV